MALPTMPSTHAWFRGGPGLKRVGNTPQGGGPAIYASASDEVWVWDEDTDTRITDLLDENANPITSPAIDGGWISGVGIPVATVIASFSIGQFGKRYELVSVQTLRNAQASTAPTDTQVQTLVNDTGSATRAALNSTYATLTALGGKAASSGLPVDGSNASGVDPTGATDCITALQAVLDANAGTAFQPQKVVRLQGTFQFSSTLFIKGSLDASNAIFNYTGSGVAVQLGSATQGNVSRWVVNLGDINCTTKPAGASWVAGSVGLKLTNASRHVISYHTISGFETGRLEVGDSTYGTGGSAYNMWFCGLLDNNLINQSLQLVTGGAVTPFVNENSNYGGAWTHSDGTYPVSGMRHILIGATGGGSLNNNRWTNCTLEGGREEYILDVYGNDNTWVDCRWETSGHNPPVRWRATAARNTIRGGYQSTELMAGQVIDAGASCNNIYGTNAWEQAFTTDGGMVLSNYTGGTSNAALTIMRGDWRRQGDTTASGYMTKLVAGIIRLKNVTDASDRFKVDYSTRTVTLGAGSSSAASAIIWGSGSPEGVQTAPIGAEYFNYAGTGFGRYVKGSGTGNTGWQAAGFQPFTTAGRPAASLAGVGGTYFDTTLGKPGWSDGTAWHDATGTAI